MKFLQKWQGRRYDPTGKEEFDFFSVQVPGNIQCDYLKHIGMENPMFSDNLTELEHTEDWWWEYQTKLEFEKSSEESLWLVSGGIDYSYDIMIDGNVIYSHEGMFSPLELDLSDKANYGSILQIVIHPHPKNGKEYIKMRSLANQCCKPAVHYGWDFNPQLLVSGLWKSIYLETRKKDFIFNCEPFYELNNTQDVAEVHFETECDSQVLYTVYDREENIVYKGTNPNFTLKSVKLWWCNGQGEPYLYRWTAETESDKNTGTIGFRTIRLVHNPYADQEPREFPKSRYPAFVTVELNGRRIFAKGSNLVNTDIYPGIVDEQRYEELVKLAKDANFNIFRLWGGAGIKKDEFYDICDRMGIMVWQEFTLACNRYEGTKKYIKVLEQEATAIIKLLRNHPSVVLWCGGNELFNGWSHMDEQDKAIRLLNKLCYELDEKTPFIMTSPLTGMAHGGYTFLDGVGGKEVYEVFQKAHATAYTEFGVPSISDYEILKQIIPDDEIENLDDTKSWRYHHATGMWGETRWACREVLEHYFGKNLTTKQLVEYSQLLQAEGYKAIFEEARRQQPYCSMVLNWCMNEPWMTAANNSIISYPLKPKPAYYAIANSLSPVLASARFSKFSWRGNETFSAELWLLNDGNDNVSDEIKAVIEIGSESYDLLDWKTGVVKDRCNKIGPTVRFVLPDSLTVEFFTLNIISKNGKSSKYILNYKPLKPKVITGQLNV